MTHLEFDCTDEKSVFLLKAARLYDEGLKNIPEWIPYSEKPKNEGFYLVTISTYDGDLMVAKEFFSENFNAFMGVEDSVKAWMPLLEPYKGE